MSEENRNLPELLAPPFWGNSDVLPYTVDNIAVRTMYCYFPVFTSSGTIILVDPYEPTEEITIITPENNQISERFLADGDLLAFVAIGKPAECNDTILTEVEELLKAELRKGLQLPAKRGELLPMSSYTLLSDENREAIEQIMTYEDRLDALPEDIELYIFIHNSTETEQ